MASLAILSVGNVPAVILLAFRFGILSDPNAPAVILLAFRFGILSALNVPDETLDASRSVNADPLPEKVADIVFVLGTNVKAVSTLIFSFPDEESTKVKK